MSTEDTLAALNLMVADQAKSEAAKASIRSLIEGGSLYQSMNEIGSHWRFSNIIPDSIQSYCPAIMDNMDRIYMNPTIWTGTYYGQPNVPAAGEYILAARETHLARGDTFGYQFSNGYLLHNLRHEMAHAAFASSDDPSDPNNADSIASSCGADGGPQDPT